MSDQRELESFLAARNKALIELDMDYARLMLPKASSDEVRLIALHKARYNCTAIPAEYRHASRKWLAERGYQGMAGQELLPEGELPK
jgi:hypothetical protein